MKYNLNYFFHCIGNVKKVWSDCSRWPPVVNPSCPEAFLWSNEAEPAPSVPDPEDGQPVVQSVEQRAQKPTWGSTTFTG